MKRDASRSNVGRPTQGLGEHVLFVRITTEDHDAIQRIVEYLREGGDETMSKAVLVRRWVRNAIQAFPVPRKKRGAR